MQRSLWLCGMICMLTSMSMMGNLTLGSIAVPGQIAGVARNKQLRRAHTKNKVKNVSSPVSPKNSAPTTPVATNLKKQIEVDSSNDSFVPGGGLRRSKGTNDLHAFFNNPYSAPSESVRTSPKSKIQGQMLKVRSELTAIEEQLDEIDLYGEQPRARALVKARIELKERMQILKEKLTLANSVCDVDTHSDSESDTE